MMQIRAIEQQDNPKIAIIIRDVLTEFGANRPGFAWQDPELDAMCESYRENGRTYLVAEADDKELLGGAGIAEFDCDLPNCCELQKMYLVSEARKLGLGQQLISALMSKARYLGYDYCYLETLSSMHGARILYRKNGFELLPAPLGTSGHNACDEWYLLKL